MEKIALVTGSNKGLGLETSRGLAKQGYTVIVTARDASKGKEAIKDLSSTGAKVAFHVLDVARQDHIEAIAKYVTSEYGRLDVLVNNAGIFLANDRASAFETSPEDVRKVFETNTMGALSLCQKLIPLMLKNKWGRVVNVSSGMGQLSEMGSAYVAYRISKTALNAVTKVFASETQGKGVLVNSVCPGWVRTDMGGKEAHRSLEEGVCGILWAATLPDDGPTGGFFRDGKPIPW